MEDKGRGRKVQKRHDVEDFRYIGAGGTVIQTVPVLSQATAPLSGTSGSFAANAPAGSQLVNTATGVVYTNEGSLASPYWTPLPRQSGLKGIWTDFEDVSLMPVYWDLASFVCNLALFRGIQQPTFRYILDHIDNTDLKSFGFAIIARTLMSTLGNLDYALAGHGNLEVASKQLELAEDFIHQIDLIIGGNDN